MSHDEIYDRLTKVFREVFDDEELCIDANTCADDVEEWDSLSHVQLIVSIEEEFGVRFTSREILKWRNVGEMADALAQKLN